MLTEAVRRRPYQLILLDEFEKAHKNVWNLLLQLFDEGHLTDSHGRKVDFRNVIVVMTSNMGAEVVANMPDHYQGNEPEVKSAIMDIVMKTLSPELINRIDEKIIFNRLQREHMGAITGKLLKAYYSSIPNKFPRLTSKRSIIDIGLSEIIDRLEESHNCKLDVSNLAKDCLAEKGYDIRYGARPLKRVLANDVLNPLSRLVLEGSIIEGDEVRVRTLSEAYSIKKEDPELSWISTSEGSDKNSVVVLRNHSFKRGGADDEVWDDEEFLMEDGVHSHR